MPTHDTASIRDALRQQGLEGADLEAAVLAFKIANNLPLDDSAEAEAIAEKKRFIAAYVLKSSDFKLDQP